MYEGVVLLIRSCCNLIILNCVCHDTSLVIICDVLLQWPENQSCFLLCIVKSALKVDIGSTSGGQATSGHSSGASPKGYALMKPPKEFRHFPEEYRRAPDKPRSVAPHPVHRLHKVEKRRAVSVAHHSIRPRGN